MVRHAALYFSRTIYNTEFQYHIEADYSIFAWRNAPSAPDSPSPIIFLRNPVKPLPLPPAYQNTSYYAFRPKPVSPQPSEPQPSEVAVSVRRRKSQGSMRSFKSGRSRRSLWSEPPEADGIPQHKRDFINFHSENGNRVVVGTFGPVTRGELATIAYISRCNESSDE